MVGVGSAFDVELVSGAFWGASGAWTTTGVVVLGINGSLGDGRGVAGMGMSAICVSMFGRCSTGFASAMVGGAGLGGVIFVTGFGSGASNTTVGIGVLFGSSSFFGCISVCNPGGAGVACRSTACSDAGLPADWVAWAAFFAPGY